MSYLIYNPVNKLFWHSGQGEGSFSGWGHRDTADRWAYQRYSFLPVDGVWAPEDAPVVKCWQDPDGPFEIFLRDLTPEAQKRFSNFYPNAQLEMNVETQPLAIIDSYEF